MQLGRFELCLKCADLAASLAFYEKLGFRQCAEAHTPGVALVENGTCRIALYEGYIEENLLNFRGGDVIAIAEEAEHRGLHLERRPLVGTDGSMAALLRDPDGNAVYLVFHPGEESV